MRTDPVRIGESLRGKESFPFDLYVQTVRYVRHYDIYKSADPEHYMLYNGDGCWAMRNIEASLRSIIGFLVIRRIGRADFKR